MACKNWIVFLWHTWNILFNVHPAILFSIFVLFVVPSPRWGHSFCKTRDNKAVVIGGQGIKSQMCKDSMWQFDASMYTFIVMCGIVSQRSSLIC